MGRADPGRGHHRQAGRQRLLDRHAPALLAGRVDEEVGEAVHPGQLRVGDVAGEDGASREAGGGEALEGAPLRPVAHQEEAEILARERREGAQQVPGRLAPAHLGDREDHPGRFRDPQARPPVPPLGGRERRGGAKVLDVDRVGEAADPLRGEAARFKVAAPQAAGGVEEPEEHGQGAPVEEAARERGRHLAGPEDGVGPQRHRRPAEPGGEGGRQVVPPGVAVDDHQVRPAAGDLPAEPAPGAPLRRRRPLVARQQVDAPGDLVTELRIVDAPTRGRPGEEHLELRLVAAGGVAEEGRLELGRPLDDEEEPHRPPSGPPGWRSARISR